LPPESALADEPIAWNGSANDATAKRTREKLQDGAEAELNYQA
jgi:hypothetical protein